MDSPTVEIHISYARGERDLAAALARRLEERGIACDYDARIGPGPALRPETGPERASMLVILLSAEAHDPTALGRQLTAADRLGRPVIVLLVENVTPRGAVLLALSARIAVQVYPEPMTRLDEIAGFLEELTIGTEQARRVHAASASIGDRQGPHDEALGSAPEEAPDLSLRAPRNREAYLGPAGSTVRSSGAIGALAGVVTLGAYGLLARGRAIRRFRSNSRKL